MGFKNIQIGPRSRHFYTAYGSRKTWMYVSRSFKIHELKPEQARERNFTDVGGIDLPQVSLQTSTEFFQTYVNFVNFLSVNVLKQYY